VLSVDLSSLVNSAADHDYEIESKIRHRRHFFFSKQNF